MPQNQPIYGDMASCTNPIIQSYIKETYGKDNLCWPIVWLKEDQIIWYTYERTRKCDTNQPSTNKPSSLAGKSSYFVDYLSNPRVMVPLKKELLPSIGPMYNCSYDYIPTSEYNTVDIDYVWKKTESWVALEFITWHKRFTSVEEAERLISFINRRPSWQGPAAQIAIKKQIDAAKDLGCKYTMGCVNSEGVSNKIVTDGNAYWFELNTNQLDRLLNARVPEGAVFGTFKQFLNSL